MSDLTSESLLDVVPSSRDLLSVRSGDVPTEKAAAALKEGLLSSSPAAVKKAARTLQVYESYQRKAGQDRENFKGTGFTAFMFPEMEMKLSAADAQRLVKAVAATRDPATVDIVLMLVRRRIAELPPEEAKAVLGDASLKDLATGGDGQLKGSDGKESPRGGAKSFQEEWTTEVEPGMKNIREAIIETAVKRGPTCPYARGNHAKGVEFGNVTMKTADDAPDWVKELFGSTVKGGMIRVSMSTTNPDEPDSKNQQQPDVRVVLPLVGGLADGTAKQILDITANTGATTHAVTARRHTEFTKRLTTSHDGSMLDSDPMRVARFLGSGLTSGELRERIWELRSALDVAKLSKKQALHEHQLFGRHAYFIGGRYVQIRMKVTEPMDFANPQHDPRPNARQDVVAENVAKKGMKLAMYMTEIPEGKPGMAEEEGWAGLRSTEHIAGTFEVPAQPATSDSAAAQWFQSNTFAQSSDLLAQPVGLGRHRIPAYRASMEQRLASRA